MDALIRRLNHEPDYRVGYCRCGCGQRTNPHNRKPGEVRVYRNGHASRKMQSVHVDSGSGCWIWMKGLHRNGYGEASTDDGTRIKKQAHRMVWEWVHGEVPEGKELDHICRNRPCVNPAHLRVVTRAENTQCGLAAKLNPEKVRLVRDLHIQGLSERKIAKAVGVSRGTARSVIIGHTWKNIS